MVTRGPEACGGVWAMHPFINLFFITFIIIILTIVLHWDVVLLYQKTSNLLLVGIWNFWVGLLWGCFGWNPLLA